MSQLDILAQHRDAILLAEIGAWLHMLGKYHECFLRGTHDLDIKIPPDLKTHYPRLNELLTDSWPGGIWSRLPAPELNASTLSIFNLIKSHRKSQAGSGLERLMWDAHGRGSGVEKGVLERFAPGQKDVVFPATAFGNELSAIDLKQLRGGREKLYEALEIWLEELHNKNAALSEQEWIRLRHDFVSRLATEWRNSVAETRRPLNDVTLFDQTATSVALLKASLAQNLLTGWKEPRQTNVKDKYQWRLLRVGLAGPAFWGTAVRISDLLARKDQVDVALNHVRDRLEVIYPLGAEVYRDEGGSLFIVPDIADLLDATIDRETLQDQLNEIAEKVLDGETLFTFELSKQTRNVLILGRLAAAKLPEPAPRPEWLRERWQEGKRHEICSVCGLRPQGSSKKAVDRKVCDVCEQRRGDRSKRWIDELKSTIWIDEVADNNGRLGLLIGHFGVETWLTGEALSTILMFDPTNRDITDSGRKNKNKEYKFDYAQLTKDIEKAIHCKQFKCNTLLDNLVLPHSRGDSFEQFYDIQVTDSDLSGVHTTRSATLLTIAMLRQNPSFARIRRVWETTRRFWQEVLPIDEDRSSTQSLAAHHLGQTGLRLAITGTLIPRRTGDTLGPYHAYELVLSRGITLSIIWDEQKRRFITAENLAYIAQLLALSPSKPEKVKDTLHGTFIIEEPTGYGNANAIWGEMAIQDVQEIPNSTYIPIIPILAEPRTFMALVPADKALDIMHAIKEKYEREMGKVRNRLPLHLGVVYAHRRTPLRTVLDAGRRMLQQRPLGGEQTWTVKADAQLGTLPPNKQVLVDSTHHFDQTIRVQLEQNGRTINWYVPAVMGDGTTEDLWYPYVFVETNGNDAQIKGRNRVFKGLRPTGANTGSKDCWLVHASELRQGDQVYFTPATFDFEWLDTSARRFEIAYNAQGERYGRLARPYLLDDLENLQQAWRLIAGTDGLASGQIYALRDTIEAQRETWRASPHDETFRQLCKDVIHNAAWKEQPAETSIEKLTQWAVTGLLADTVELYMGVMKQKPQLDSV